jgi:hypothetical protein
LYVNLDACWLKSNSAWLRKVRCHIRLAGLENA